MIEASTKDAKQVQGTHVIDALASANTPEQLNQALDLCLVVFDHHNTEIHNYHSKAIIVVVRCMERDSCEASDLVVDKYIRLVDLMLRCADTVAVEVFYRLGGNLVAQILFQLSVSNQTSDDVERSSGRIVDRVCSLHVELPTLPMKDILIRSMHRALQCRGEKESLLVLRLLRSWTQIPENKYYVMHLPGLLDTILSTVSENSRAAVLGLVANLASDSRNKVELVETRNCCKVLLAGLEDSGASVRDSACILSHLATDVYCRKKLLKYKSIVDQLIRKMFDKTVRDEIHLALLRLITKESASQFLKKNFVSSLESSAKSLDSENNAAVLAAQALRRLSSFVSVQDKQFSRLLDSLIYLSHDPRSQIRLWGVRGIAEVTKKSTGRFLIVRTLDVMNLLVRLARSDQVVAIKSTAIEALCNMALDKANAKRIVSVHEILAVLVENANCADESNASGRLAIQAILSLVMHKNSDKERVAKTIGLVEVLTKFGVSSDLDEGLKRAALRGVVVLAQLM